MTFDIEAWYHGNFTDYNYRQFVGNVDDLVESQTRRILDFLDETENKATFFILGEIAKEHPELVKEIHSREHEVASHFMHHDLIYDMPAEKFRTELRRGIDILQQLIGKSILGFRAPSWSVSMEKTPWFWEILRDEGLLYSSSRFPIKTYLYGDSGAPLFAHDIETRSGSICEFPPSCTKFASRKIPFSGGFYFRFLPKWFILKGIKWFEEQNQPVVFYLHPKEIDPNTPELPLKFLENKVHKYGAKKCMEKLRRIIEGIKSTSFTEYFNLQDE